MKESEVEEIAREESKFKGKERKESQRERE